MVTSETTQASRASARRAALLGMPLRGMAIVSLLLVLPGVARPDDFWKHKPSTQWSSAEALKLVRRSPWARLEVVVLGQKENEAAYSVPTGTMHCDPDAIDQNGNCLQKGRIEAPVDSSRQMDAAPLIKPWAGILVRWESAAPVAQAFARLEELGEGPAAGFQAPAPRLPADRYVITVKVEEAGRKGFEPFTVTPTGKPVFVATLKTRRGIVAPLEVEFTGVGASSSVHYFFPRTLAGAPLLGPGRDWAEFTLLAAGFAVHAKFTLDPEFLSRFELQRNDVPPYGSIVRTFERLRGSTTRNSETPIITSHGRRATFAAVFPLHQLPAHRAIGPFFRLCDSFVVADEFAISPFFFATVGA